MPELGVSSPGPAGRSGALHRLLSERYRPVLLPLAVALLVAACASWVHLHLNGEAGHSRLLQEPVAHDGEPVVLSLVTVGTIVGADRYQVEDGTLSLTVLGPTEGLTEGVEYTVVGSWDARALAVQAQEVHEARGRPAKKALGIVGLLATALLLPLWFQRGPDGLQLRG